MIFSTLELARRLDQAEGMAGASFVETRRAAYPDSGAEWTEIGGSIVLYDGPASPVTQVFCLGLFQPVTLENLNSIESFYRSRGAATGVAGSSRLPPHRNILDALPASR